MKKQRNHSEKRNPKRILRRVVSLLLCVVLMAGMVMPHMTVRANVETPEFTYVLFKEGANGTPVQYEAEWSEDSKVYTVGLPVMWIGTYYEIQLLADNSPTSWSFMGYTLPEGMTYNTETGLISGTPTSGASGYSVVSVTNDAGTSTDRMWLTMIFLSEEKKTKITTASILPQAEVNKSYNITLDSAGYYCPGATTWSLVSGNLPEGLALTQVGFDDGKLSGTPTKKGTYHFTIQAANAAGVDSREFTLVVGDNSGILLSDIKRYDFPDQYTGYIDTGSSKEFTISNGTESTLENISITLGGTNASAFTVSPANIDSLASGESTPFHVSLANGALAAGTYTATVTVASDTYTQCEDVCVKVIESPADGKPIILSDGLSDGHAPGALIGSPYSFSLNAVGAGIKWSLVNGYELPEGLILNEDTGEISGTPAAGAKSKYIYLKATNPSGYKEKGFNLDVFEVPEITAKEDTTVYDDTLPDGFVGQNYGHGIMLSSGSNHAKLMLTNGTLPSFSESFNGEETWRYVSYYSSRPTENDIGGHTFTVMAVLMDYCGNVLTTVSKTYTMNIYDALTVTGSASITNPRVGQAITPVDLSGLVGGGKPPYSYALDTDEKLPDGLTLNASTGVISGTPTQMNADYANVSLCVTDSASNYRSILLNVAPVLKIVAIPAAVTGLEYTATEQTGVATDEGYTVTGGSATDVGDYTATVSLQNGAVWSDETYEEKEISWSIEKRTVTVIPDSLSKDYGETDPVLTYSTDLGTDALRNAFALTATGELAREAGEDAGTYLISQSTFAAGSNFDMTFSTTPVNFTINKIPDPAVVNATATVKCGNTVSLENNVTGNVGTVSYAVQTALTGCSVDASNGVFTAGDTAGTCVVAVTVAESTNYNQRIIPITVTVTEKDIANLDVIQTGTTYGQTLENPEYEVTGGVLNTKIRYSGTLRADGSQYDSEEKPFAAGNYTVSVTCETADTIYSGSAEFVIAPANIDTAEVVLGSGLTYDGTIQTQNLSEVNCNDENILSSCNITGNTATNAGTYTLTVTAKVASNYTGLVQKEFSVAKAMPTAGDFTISSVLTKTYNGSPFSITVPTTSKTGMGTVTLKYAGGSEAPRDAGNYPLTINVTEGDNYQSVDSLAIGTMVINKAQWKYSKSILVDVISGGRGTVSLSELIAPGGTLGKLDTADTNQILKGTPEITTSAESEKMLAVSLINDSEKADMTATVTIPVQNATNYEDYDITATVRLLGKKEQSGFSFASGTVSKTYGAPDFTVTATGEAEGSVVTYSSADTDIATIDANGTVHILAAGDTVISTSASETAEYRSKERSFTLHISKASLTIKAADLTVKVGDAVPNLSAPVAGTHYTVIGLVGTDTLSTAPTLVYRKGSKTVTPDTSEPRKYDIAISGATVPNANYNDEIRYEKGSLTISEEQKDHAHTLVHHARVEATETTPGNIEYWECSGCGGYFSDADGKNEINATDIVIPAGGTSPTPTPGTGEDVTPTPTPGTGDDITPTPALKEGEVYISPEDAEVYVTPAKVSKETPVSVAVDGNMVSLNLKYDYTNAVTYTGEKIAPDGDFIKAKLDLSDIVSQVSANEGVKLTQEELFTVSYKISNNKDVSRTKNASFYARIKINKGVNKLMPKAEYKKLQKLVSAANKLLKANKCEFTINPKPVTESSAEIIAKFKKDGTVKTAKKTGLLSGEKVYVSLKKKTKLSKKMYTMEAPVTGTDGTITVKLTGKKNYTGTAVVTIGK